MNIISLVFLYTIYFAEIINYINLDYIIYEEKVRRKWSILVGAVILFIVLLITPITDIDGKTILTYVCIGGVVYYMLQGRWIHRLGKMLEMFLLVECSEGIIFIIFELIGMEKRLNELILNGSMMVERVVVLGIWGIVYLIKKKKSALGKKVWRDISKTLHYWIVLMAVGMLVTIAGLDFAKNYVPNEKFAVAIKICSLVSYLGVGILSIFVYYIKSNRENMEEMLRREILAKKMQQCYYEELLEKEEDTRKYRHDMINHLICITGLAKEQNCDELVKYVEKMLKQVTEIQKKTYTIGNQVLDIITNYYLNMLNSKVKICITGMVDERLVIDSDVLCTIYANVLQNAIEELSKGEEGYLNIAFLQGNEYIQFSVENSLYYKTREKKNIFFTEKENKKNHGIGLKNVKKTIEENEGRMDIIYDDKKFKIEIILRNK